MKFKAVPAITVVAVVCAAVLLPALPASAASTGTIIVQVQRPSGSSLSLSNVVVTATSAASTITRKTDRHGRVSFRLPSKAIERITVAKSGYITGTHSRLKVVANRTLHPRVTLAKGATATGTLTRATGGALANSVVTLFTRAGTFVQSTKTNSRGIYKFIGLKSGSYVPQFNSRTVYDTASAAITGFTTTYLTGTDWATAHAITLHNQGRTSAASVLTRLNSVVPVGHSLSGGLSIVDLGSSGSVGLQGSNAATSIVGPLTGLGTGFDLRIPRGTYKLWISNGLSGSSERKLWYTGSAIVPSFNESDAATVTFSGDTDMNVTMNLLTSILTNPGDMLPTVPTLPTEPTDPTLPTLPTVPGLPTLPTVPGLPTLPAIPGLPTVPGIGDSGTGDLGSATDPAVGVGVEVGVTVPGITVPPITIG